jgi:para-aminobenzoate synthetase/4-amino-4-deoxychorismate lyase
MRDFPLVRFQAFEKRIELDQIDFLRSPVGDYNVSGWKADSTPDQYGADLATIGRAIMAGEVTQLKHTFRLHAAFNGDPTALYRDLLLSQRGPHGGYLDAERYRIASASPEGFFQKSGNSLAVRPVLASIKRGRWLEEDRELASLLRIDGEENYANRLVVEEIEAELAEVGELIPRDVPEGYSVERFETLWHLVTEVKAALAPGTRVVDIFKALFPPVSVTGVPKVEAMGLVAATEDTPRGVYCGAIGYLAPRNGTDVDSSFSVAVRTVVVDEDEGVAQYGVGTAITDRSAVVSAYQETRLKAKLLVERRPDFMLIAEIRCEEDVPSYAAEKITRLEESAEYFGFAFNRAEIEAKLDAAAGQQEASIVTVVVDRNGGSRTETAVAPPWRDGPDGAAVVIGAVADRQVSSQNVYLFHDTTNRRVADSLRRKHPDAEVVIACNEQDELAGALGSNVVVHIDGRWLTPPVGSGTSPTMFRDRLIAAGTIVEGRVSRDDVLAADDIGLIDDVHGWRVVGLVG